MKRIGGLLPQVAEMENLRVAFYKALLDISSHLHIRPKNRI